MQAGQRERPLGFNLLRYRWAGIGDGLQPVVGGSKRVGEGRTKSTRGETDFFIGWRSSVSVGSSNRAAE